MLEHHEQADQRNQSIVVKEEMLQCQLKHPMAVATKITNKFLHIYIYFSHNHQLKSEIWWEQIQNNGKQFECNLQAQNIYYSYLQEEKLYKEQVLQDWFSTLHQFQEYVEDVNNVLVDIQGNNIRVIKAPFQGKIKTVQIWRSALVSRQELLQAQAGCYINKMYAQTQLSNKDLTLILKILAQKLLTFCQTQLNEPTPCNNESIMSQYQKNILTLTSAEKIKNLQAKFDEFSRQKSNLIRSLQEKMQLQCKINEKKITQLSERINVVTGKKCGEIWRTENEQTQANDLNNQLINKRMKELPFPTRQSYGQYHAHDFLEKCMNKNQNIKEESGQRQTRRLYRIKNLREFKQQDPFIPSFIDAFSAYIFCFSFSATEITLKKRPPESESRHIMLLTNLKIKLQGVSTYRIRIPKFLSGSVGFGLVDSSNRKKKHCKTKENLIKVSSKGLINDGRCCSKQKSFHFTFGDTITMNVYFETGIIEWIVTSTRKKEIRTSCTNLAIKDVSIIWVPFLEMRCIADTVEWVQ